MKTERDAILRSFIALSNDPEQLNEAEEIEENLNTVLPEEPEAWWEG